MLVYYLLILPCPLRRQQNIAGATPGATRGAAPGQGAIVYEADDADDYDDEDPDDDLDI